MIDDINSYAALNDEQKMIVDGLVKWVGDRAPVDLIDEQKQIILGFVNLSASMAIVCMIEDGYMKIGRG